MAARKQAAKRTRAKRGAPANEVPAGQDVGTVQVTRERATPEPSDQDTRTGTYQAAERYR